jgi:hypothetical protein
MTTDYNFTRFQLPLKKSSFDNLKPGLFSPLTLILLLALLFTFFMTASSGSNYSVTNDREIIKTEMTKEEKKKATALRYERIVSSADPIRSILQ